MFNLPEPSQAPDLNDWLFVDELKSPLHRKPHWSRYSPKPGELYIGKGVRILKSFPDPEGLLDTAWQDLERFFDNMGIPVIEVIEFKNIEFKNINSENIKLEISETLAHNNVKSPDSESEIVTIQAIEEEQGCFESYCIEISQNYITIKAGDTEGIRRGIFYLEDLILESEGPFLTQTVIKRTPWIKNRISRCFFGPIKRPPFNRDELMDDVDYYPDEYLNRLAHEGINILWLTVEFRDICKTDLVPEYGKDSDKRLEKLGRTVEKCRRYGIKTFIFCIEPRIWGLDDPLILNHPEVAGARNGNDICFCPFTEVSQQYLYEAVKSIFERVPKLGGMISITHGERTTSCLSSVPATSEADVKCPRCSKKEKGEILEATHKPILRAMHEINPDAQFISWLYMPQVTPTAQWKYTIPEKLPKDTVMVFNFESGGEKVQLGKIRVGGDYWQSYVGPSHRFVGMAKAAEKAGIKMGAKIQVGCSHEVATVPFVPVPTVLWKKYKAMYNLKVTTVIQSWYFGNYPGIMNKTAGELAFEDSLKIGSIEDDMEFTMQHDEFLHRLARIDWGKYAGKVVEAWKYLYKAYSNFPMDVAFQYYGPMHDGVVWPLYLFPVHKPLAPTWKLDFPTSGDSIGECLISFTLKEVITLCKQMVNYWKKGVEVLKEIQPHFKDDQERLKDITVAEALGIQFESGLNILMFYDLRDQILHNYTNKKYSENDLNYNKLYCTNNLNCANKQSYISNHAYGNMLAEKITLLDEMESIVKGEIDRSLKMVELCKFDSRLGFHSEAEGYKYFPEKLLWRVKQLEYLLKEEFPRMRKLIENACWEELERITTPLNAPVYKCSDSTPAKAKTFEWSARVDGKVLYINVICNTKLSYADGGNNTINYNENSTNSNIRNNIVEDDIIEDKLFLHIKAGDLGYPYNFNLNLKTPEINDASEKFQETVRKSYTDIYIGFPINCYYEIKHTEKNIFAGFEIDLEKMPGYRGQSALAISIVRYLRTSKEVIQDEWSGENPHIRHRLCLSNYNPESMGRLELG